MSSPAIAPSRVQLQVRRFSDDTRNLLLLVFVSFAIVAPAVIWGIPTNRNLYNHLRFTLPFYDAIRHGHWYPGWLAESNGGYGDPSFRFYPPGVYYLLALTRTLTGSWFSGTLLSIGILFGLAGGGVYFWAREFVSSRMAIWAAILYTVAPYHLVQIYQAFLLAEFAGAAILPFAFAFTERVCRHRRARDIAGLAASYALLILTHLPLAVIGSIALAFYALLRLETGKRIHTLLALAAGAGLGLAASASYWTTMIAELSWIQADHTHPDPSLDYRNNFIFSTFSPDNLNVWWMNILLIASLALFWPGLTVFRRQSSVESKRLRATALLFLFTIFMATPLSRPLWFVVHPLQETQFPWRWLTLTSMVGPIVVAGSLTYWAGVWKSPKRAIALLTAGMMLASVAFSFSHIIREAGFLTETEFNKTLEQVRGSQGISYWWPVWVVQAPRVMKSEIEAGSRLVSIGAWDPEKRVFQVGDGSATEARVRTFFYPFWTATAEGKSLQVRPDTDGALLISIPAKATAVTLEFKEPPRVHWSMLSALAAWFMVTLLAVFGPLLRPRRRLSPTI